MVKDLKDLKPIAVTKTNYFRLKKLGYAGDSFDDVITKLLDEGPGVHFGLEPHDRHQATKSDIQDIQKTLEDVKKSTPISEKYSRSKTILQSR